MTEALKYIRAHQYLYYCLGNTVVSDRDYDEWGSIHCKEEYKGGSDCEAHYSDEIKELARKILKREAPKFPF